MSVTIDTRNENILGMEERNNSGCIKLEKYLRPSSKIDCAILTFRKKVRRELLLDSVSKNFLGEINTFQPDIEIGEVVERLFEITDMEKYLLLNKWCKKSCINS